MTLPWPEFEHFELRIGLGSRSVLPRNVRVVLLC